MPEGNSRDRAEISTTFGSALFNLETFHKAVAIEETETKKFDGVTLGHFVELERVE